MNKTAELGSWISEYFEGHSADYFEKKILVSRERGAYVKWTEGGFIVRDGEGRQFVYSQVEGPSDGLITRMSLEWELSDGGTFKPFGLKIIEKEGGENRVALGIQALWPRLSGDSGVFLDYENDMWKRRGGIWFDSRGNLEKLPAKIRDNVPVSNRFEYCVPVDMGVTIPLWLMKLEDGDFSMPEIMPASRVVVEGFEWMVPYQERGSTFFPDNTRHLSRLLIDPREDVDQGSWGKIARRVMQIDSAMRVRFLQERT